MSNPTGAKTYTTTVDTVDNMIGTTELTEVVVPGEKKSNNLVENKENNLVVENKEGSHASADKKLAPPEPKVDQDCCLACWCPCYYVYMVGNEIDPELQYSTILAVLIVVAMVIGIPPAIFVGIWRYQLMQKVSPGSKPKDGLENPLKEFLCCFCCACFTLTATARDLREFKGEVGGAVKATETP